MTGFLRVTAVAALAMALLGGRAATADELTSSTRESLQAVISQQIDAFGREDAIAAESFAAPGIKARFPDPQQFFDMVRQAYAPLIKPQSTRFEQAGSTATGPVQAVTVVDREGNAWTALYTFEDVGGTWRINGCMLLKQESTAT